MHTLAHPFDASPIRIIRRTEPFVPVRIENTRYLLKTADQYSELREVMRLRARIFSAEYGSVTAVAGFDIDDFDFQCDHLIILDKVTQSIVGTYRVLCSRFVDDFYSSTEFDLGRFLAAPGIKLELGRACIAPEHRRGATLSLLWRGIVRYAQETRSDYLFGCSSIKTTDPAAAKGLLESLKSRGLHSDEWGITPVGKHRIPGFSALTGNPGESLPSIPSLLQSYLNAGARVHGEPAIDSAFGSIDFLTLLKTSNLSPSHEKFHTL